MSTQQQLVTTLTSRSELAHVLQSSFSDNDDDDDLLVVVFELPATPNQTSVSQQRIDMLKSLLMDTVPQMDPSLVGHTVQLYLLLLDDKELEKDDIVPVVNVYVDGEKAGECVFEGSSGSNASDELEREKQDITLFLMSHFIAHKHFLQDDALEFESDDEEEEEDDDDGRQDDQQEAEGMNARHLLAKLLAGNMSDDDDDDDDEYQNEDEDENDDDDDDELEEEEGGVLPGLREALRAQMSELESESSSSSAAAPLPDAITREEVMQVWEQVAEKLDGDALRFVTFRNAMSPLVKSVFFKASPVNKMLAALADPAPPTGEDLEELIKEADEVDSADKNPVSFNCDDEVAEVVLKKREKAQRVQRDSGRQWSDDIDYELIDDDEMEQESGEQGANDWKTLGADLMRLQIGSWSVERQYKGQFRLKIDVPSRVLLYNMFTFVDSAIDARREATIHRRPQFTEYMLEKLDTFISQSRLLQMAIPLDNIVALHYHISEADPGLCLLAFDLRQSPHFRQRSMSAATGLKWDDRADFSSDHQASTIRRHYIVGYHEELQNIISLLLNVGGDDLKRVYREHRMASLADQPEWSEEERQSHQFPPELSDQPFESAKGDDSGEQCCVM